MPRLKLMLSVVTLSALFASYLAFAAYSANTQTARAIMANAQTLHSNWTTLTSTLGIDPRTTQPGSLSPVLERNHSALDWLVYGEHVMAEPYKEGFRELNIKPIMNEIHVSNRGEQLIYNVSGSKLNNIAVLDDGTTAVFYSKTYRPIIEALLAQYDPKPFSDIGDNTGIIRYGKMQKSEYAVGIYFPPGSSAN